MVYNTFFSSKETQSSQPVEHSKQEVLDKSENNSKENNNKKEILTNSDLNIDELTSEEIVVPFVKNNAKLPDYYITKGEARSKGWIASKGNLCDVLPGRAIGGDNFSNREKNLPSQKGRKWYEADLNYNCGNRNADRLLYSNDGLVYVTHDHYKTFDKK